jgi:filamin
VASGDGLHQAVEDKPARFVIDTQKMRGGLEITVEGPNQYTKNQVERQADGTYLVKYTPVECGLFKVFIKWNQKDLPHSPFMVTVINPEKVKVVGGWQSILDRDNILKLNPFEERTISFDTSECGPGKLTALISAPNGTNHPLKLSFNPATNIYDLTFTAVHDGEYKINLCLNGHPISSIPIVARTAQVLDLSRIDVSGAGLLEAKVGQESSFVIDGSRAGAALVGAPDLKMAGTRSDIHVQCSQVAENVYKCTYVPQLPGAYLLNINWSGNRQVGESPYKVNILC